MKKIISNILFTLIGLNSVAAFAQSNPTQIKPNQSVENIDEKKLPPRTNMEFPPIVATYATNLVDIEICKKYKLAIKPMDQRLVLKEYIQATGQRDYFATDVRKLTSLYMEYYGYSTDEQKIAICKNKIALEKALEDIKKPPKLTPVKPVNPLDMP